MITLLDAVKMAYRKHVLDDPNVGWSELDDILLSALCNEMGDAKFQEWLLSTRNRLFHKMSTNKWTKNDKAEEIVRRVEAGSLPCGHDQGIDFGESHWSCAVCGQPVHPPRDRRRS